MGCRCPPFDTLDSLVHLTCHLDQLYTCLQVDMLVGDIYGDRDYSSIGLSASTIASSFGKVIARGSLERSHQS